MLTASRPIIAWSYSALEMFENCPRKFWAVRIQKCVSDVNKFNVKGDSAHDSFAHYLKQGLALPPHLMFNKPLLDKVKVAPGEKYVEYKMTLDSQFVPCGFKDWNKAWVRVVSDLLIVNGDKAQYLDWKDGKFRPSDDQIDLAALVIFQHFPDVQQVAGGLVFFNHNKVHPRIVQKSEAPLLWNSWLSRVKELETAVQTDSWPATPNPLCGWCPYAACPHNTNKDLPK